MLWMMSRQCLTESVCGIRVRTLKLVLEEGLLKVVPSTSTMLSHAQEITCPPKQTQCVFVSDEVLTNDFSLSFGSCPQDLSPTTDFVLASTLTPKYGRPDSTRNPKLAACCTNHDALDRPVAIRTFFERNRLPF